jgi:hypothetical protein
VSWHADGGALLELMEDVQICKVMSEYAVAPVSSDGGGAWRRQGVHSSQGDEAPLLPLLEAVKALPLLEAVKALPLLLSPSRSHCSNYAAVEALPLSNRIYLDGRR